MQRISVGLYKKPVKQLNANNGVKVARGEKILDFPGTQVDSTPVAVAA